MATANTTPAKTTRFMIQLSVPNQIHTYRFGGFADEDGSVIINGETQVFSGLKLAQLVAKSLRAETEYVVEIAPYYGG